MCKINLYNKHGRLVEKMTEKIGLFYFSGTNNTLLVTDLIKETFEKKGISVEVFAIDDLIKNKIKLEFDRYSMIGIGYPIYGFGSPNILKTFEKFIPKGKGTKVFIYTTAASNVSVNHNAMAPLKRQMKKKGYHVFYERIICMGSNYLVRRSKEFEKKLYLVAIDKVKDVCNAVLNEEKREYKLNSIFASFLSMIHWFENHWLAPIFGVSLRANRKCNQCGLCLRMCPTGNIVKKDNQIKFKRRCLMCMRCIYSCPQKAITSSFLNFFILKNGYDIKAIINDKTITGGWNQKEKRLFEDYVKDISI